MAAVAGGGGDSCHCLRVREQGRGSRGLVLDAMRGRGVEREKERRVRALPPEELKGQISKGVGLVLTRLRGERAIFVECVVPVPVRSVADQRIPFVPSRRGRSRREVPPSCRTRSGTCPPGRSHSPPPATREAGLDPPARGARTHRTRPLAGRWKGRGGCGRTGR